MFRKAFFAGALSLLFSLNSTAVELQNEVTEALQDCFKADFARSEGSMPNVANHGDVLSETRDQEPSTIKPVIQIKCEGEIAKKFMSAASKHLQYKDSPYSGCTGAGTCTSTKRQFFLDGKGKPGHALCVTDTTIDLAVCLFGAVFPMSYKN